jgi:hypothetical protein
VRALRRTGSYGNGLDPIPCNSNELTPKRFPLQALIIILPVTTVLGLRRSRSVLSTPGSIRVLSLAILLPFFAGETLYVLGRRAALEIPRAEGGPGLAGPCLNGFWGIIQVLCGRGLFGSGVQIQVIVGEFVGSSACQRVFEVSLGLGLTGWRTLPSWVSKR